jgi:hypothetical protein
LSDPLEPEIRKQDGAGRLRRFLFVTTAARFVAAILGAFLLPVAAASGQVVERRVLIVAPDDDDERVMLAREAVAFWNRTLSDLDLDVRLREPDLVIAAPNSRAMENFARQVSQRGGRLPKGSAGPQPPSELTNLQADVVLLLSRQPLMPFAWALPSQPNQPSRSGSPEFFVAIRTREPERRSDDKVLRNVIAHELGHTLGLSHHRATATLMCGPCSSAAAVEAPQEWLPLTADDQSRLRELHLAQ